MTHEQKTEFVFEVPAKNPRKKANFISKLFFRWLLIIVINHLVTLHATIGGIIDIMVIVSMVE